MRKARDPEGRSRARVTAAHAQVLDQNGHHARRLLSCFPILPPSPVRDLIVLWHPPAVLPPPVQVPSSSRSSSSSPPSSWPSLWSISPYSIVMISIRVQSASKPPISTSHRESLTVPFRRDPNPSRRACECAPRPPPLEPSPPALPRASWGVLLLAAGCRVKSHMLGVRVGSDIALFSGAYIPRFFPRARSIRGTGGLAAAAVARG